MTTMQQNPKQTGQPGDSGCSDCKDKDNATQVSININRTALCKLLYDERGIVSKLETRFSGENDVYKEKRCIFLNTEKSYRRYRNFEITTGTELLTTNDSVKATVTQLQGWNKTLGATLTNLFKQIKDLKTKFSDLKDASCKLDSAYKDKCNIGQKKAITGKGGDNCPDGTPVDACKDSDSDFLTLICKPKGLAQDVDSIFQSSSDVIGIQVFSNIDSLTQLQTDLSTRSTAFEALINSSMKTRKSDLDKMQDDLVASVKSITQTAVSRNSERANFEGYYDATKFLCCPACACVPVESTTPTPGTTNTAAAANNNSGNKDCDDCCPPRLKECEQAICTICDAVKTTFCCDADTPPPSTPPTSSPTKKGCY
jgi:cell division protein FtsB